MATLKVTDEKFEEQVLKNEKPVLVDFWAEWGGPCKMVGPILEEISEEMANDIVIAKHDIDSEPNMPTKYGIRGIPTMLLFKGGELKATKVGATPKSDIVAFINEYILFKLSISPSRYKDPVIIIKSSFSGFREASASSIDFL